MEVSAAAIAGFVSVGSAQGLAFSKILLPRHSPALAIAATASGSLPIDSIAPPTIVRPDTYRSAPRALVRRRRRTRRRSLTEDGGEDGFSGDGDGDDGPFGGGGDGSGGRGWNFGGYGGPDWEESEPSPSSPDPAFDFVFEVLGFAALSSCSHFAYKKIGRFLTDREKVVPVRLVQPIC